MWGWEAVGMFGRERFRRGRLEYAERTARDLGLTARSLEPIRAITKLI